MTSNGEKKHAEICERVLSIQAGDDEPGNLRTHDRRYTGFERKS